MGYLKTLSTAFQKGEGRRFSLGARLGFSRCR